jgi:flavin-dependent dehydrogenase
MSAALTLARLGAYVVVVDRSFERPTLGEGLPPAARPVLDSLGLWDRFLADGHRPAYGNRSFWGRSASDEYDFIRSPYGVGWHLDRLHFDSMLRTAFVEAGGALYSLTRAVELRRTVDGEWELVLSSGTSRWTAHCDFVIDATGRSRWIGRALGVRRRVYDRLVGVVATLHPKAALVDRDSFTTVESVQDGWWYATVLPDGRLAIGYMTDADLAVRSGARTASRWMALLDQTLHIRQRATTHGYKLDGAPRLICADSSYLATVAGDGWCAVGDAAGAHDPLSSQGITAALVSGVWAARALAKARDGGIDEYKQRMQQAYARYVANWMTYYTVEQRWPASLFWQRRHVALEQLLQ